ncbi:MAG: hypothetical protein ACREA9_29425 [Pyrinomonadaceae bacterium]
MANQIVNYLNSQVQRFVLVVVACSVLLGSSNAADGYSHTKRQTARPRLGREFKLKAGQEVTLKGARLRIKFAAVENDSRCPSDVTCVWAGNAAVQLQLSAGRGSKTVTLNTSKSPSFVGESEYRGYKVKLVDLSPYPRSDRKIAARDYTVTLLVGMNE